MTPEQIEKEIQRLGETRLMDAQESLYEDEAGHDLAGPYCGCETCVVREVISAAWPMLYRLAHHPDTEDPNA